jgi:hypothetical protein
MGVAEKLDLKGLSDPDACNVIGSKDWKKETVCGKCRSD